MKVLWLSSTNTLFCEKGDRAYNGKGWIASLQDAVTEFCPDIELAVAFLTGGDPGVVRQGGVTYFKIRKQSPKGLRKLLNNWTGGHIENYDSLIREIAGSFSPDLIHIFGCESKLASAVLSVPEIPSVIHIQGILSEAERLFFPPGMTSLDFISARTLFNEAILRNGSIHLREDYAMRAVLERRYLGALKYAMGRTDWDRQTLQKYSGARYFHVEEVMRPEFYAAAGKYAGRKSGDGTDVQYGGSHDADGRRRIRLLSTISEVPYKGMDMILRAAHLLAAEGYDVRWAVAGVSSGSDTVRIFERWTGIHARDCGVRLCGVLGAAELVREMMSADIYVHPSYCENSSNSICEAQMVGIPVVATDAGGTSSLILDNVTGRTVPCGDAAAMASAIRELVSSPAAMESIGKAGAGVASARHDRAGIAGSLASVYRTILQDAGQKSIKAETL